MHKDAQHSIGKERHKEMGEASAGFVAREGAEDVVAALRGGGVEAVA